MRFLVTGGAGFLGSALVHRLVRDGHFVRVLDNGYRGFGSRLPDVEVVWTDIRHEDRVVRAARDVDTIVHLADVNGTENFYKDPQLVLDVAVRGMQSVLRASQGIETLLVASSSEVYHDHVYADEGVPLTIPDVTNPRYSYAGGKIIKELMTLHSNVPRRIVFRPHNIYGPDMGEEHVIPQVVRKITAGNLEIQGNGTQTRAFCHVDDFTEGLMILIAKGESGVYHVGNPEEVTIRDLVDRIQRIMGTSVPVICGPEPEGAPYRRCPDIAKLRALGFSPKIPLDKGLPGAVKWYANSAVAA